MPKYDYQKEQKLQEKVEEISTPDTIKLIEIRSRIEAHLQYTGKVSGRQYEWAKAGQTVPVLAEDVPDLLSKKLGKKSCCGNGENKIFELAQEA